MCLYRDPGYSLKEKKTINNVKMGLQETIGGQIKVGRNKWVQTQFIISWKTIFSEQKREDFRADKGRISV